MPQPSGVQNAIRELEQEQKSIQNVIGMLKKILSQRNATVAGTGPRRKLSAQARRRISEAAKKRWAALRSSKGKA